MFSYKNIQTDQIIKESINGCPKMQRILYEKYAGIMLQVCLHYTNNSKADAEDILQEGFIKVFKNLQKFRNDGSFEGWIRTIITRTALGYIKQEKRNTISFCSENLQTLKDENPNVLGKLAEKDIIKIVTVLPKGYRKIFIMYVIEGYNHREIAAILNCTEGTSKSQLFRSKLKLQQLLKKRA
jgi:RNA polymerase sigma-70 factor (ECF subfamily)